jgi:hypothetical protein
MSRFNSSEYIFVRCFRHYRTKQLVYPKHGAWIRIPKDRLKRR